MLCLSGFELYSRWVPLRTYLMFTLISNNHCISALCNLVGRTYLMVTLKANSHCVSAVCNFVCRAYLMVTLNLIITAFSLCNLVGKKLNAYLLEILSSPLSMFNDLQVKHFGFLREAGRAWRTSKTKIFYFTY